MSELESRRELLTCSNVGFQFGQRTVIESFHLKINPGDRIALLGPSGCGKSTLLNLMSGLLQPTSGHIERTVSAQQISFVFQESSLIPWKTVRENLLLIFNLLNESASSVSEINAKMDHLLERVGLRDKENSWPDELSGGMKMRVALVRALLNSPRLLFLDEPFSALDDLTREHLQEDLLNLYSDTHSSFVLVTHNIEEALLLCNRVIVLARNAQILTEIHPASETTDPTLAHIRDSDALQRMRRKVRSLWAYPQTGAHSHA